jgi:polyisoprenoid-binding protein YceI
MRTAAVAALLLFASCSITSCSITGKQTTQSLQSLPSGAYQLEKPHASLLFRVKHMGLSYYTARMTDFDATLDFDPKNPAASHVKAIINPLSVRAEHPTDKDWDRRLGEDFFEGKEFPQIVFDSKKVEATGEFTGKITGDLTFMGVTEPVTLDVTFNGSAPTAALYQGRDAIGFSARGKLMRSDFGLTRYSAIVGDEVEIVIEAEFTRRG